MEYVEMIIDFVKAVMEQWDDLESIIIRLIALAETIGTGIFELIG